MQNFNKNLIFVNIWSIPCFGMSKISQYRIIAPNKGNKTSFLYFLRRTPANKKRQTSRSLSVR